MSGAEYIARGVTVSVTLSGMRVSISIDFDDAYEAATVFDDIHTRLNRGEGIRFTPGNPKERQ